MSEILKLEGVTKIYHGDKEALSNVDLTVESGKIVGLLGPNGAGKTTLIKLINGLLTPNKGMITICGQEVGTATKSMVAYLPDLPYLNNWMKVEQLVSYFSDFYSDFRTELAYELLNKLGIKPKDRLKTLSKGNKEKVCLILTMSRNAKLYVLDEPIAGVDPATRDYIISTIINNYNPESSVVISTHLISDIEEVLEDVIFINNGKIVLQSSVEQIREKKGESVDALFREVFKW